MTYAAILEAYGYDRFVADSREAGATSAIVVDLPVEDHPEVPRIQLVAPTSTDERIAACAAGTDGWLYLVSLTGTTGARDDGLPRARRPRRADARAHRPRRSTPASASRRPSTRPSVAGLADGVVVGSRAVQVAEEGPAALRDYVRRLRGRDRRRRRRGLRRSRAARRSARAGSRGSPARSAAPPTPPRRP